MEKTYIYCGHVLIMSNLDWKTSRAFFLKANKKLGVMQHEIEMYFHSHLKKTCLHETRLFRVRMHVSYLWKSSICSQSFRQLFSINHASAAPKIGWRSPHGMHFTTRNFLKTFHCAVSFHYERAHKILAFKTMKSEVWLTKRCPQPFQFICLLWKLILLCSFWWIRVFHYVFL